MRTRSAAVFVIIATLASTSAAELDDGVFSSTVWRVEMEAPPNWQATEEAAYPNLLLWMERRDPGGVMLLAAEGVEPTMDAAGYAKATTTRLETMGFAVRPPQLHTTTGASLIDFDNGTAFLRQAFLVKGGVGYTLTLSAASARARSVHLRAFDTALRSIKPARDSVAQESEGE